MRKCVMASFLAGFILIVLCASIVSAQNAVVPPSSAPAATPCPCSGTTAGTPAAPPYTAVRKTTYVHKLAIGVTITRTTLQKEARDSCGRNYRENQPEPMRAAMVDPSFTSYSVYDPIAQVNIFWNSDSTTATLNHIQRRDASLVGTAMRAGTKQLIPAREVEQLGVKSFDGHPAIGTRSTTTYAPGSVGNDLPFTVTNESWMLMDLRVPVLQIDDDPVTGVQTTELTDISPAEPDPALFHAPQGYTVKEQYPNQQN